MTRSGRLLLAPLFLAQLLFFLFIARHRFVDGDEGFYLLASRLVLMHKTPYLDFSYVQAPLLPYVYAGWMKTAAVSWASARLFSVVLTAILGTLLYDEVWKETKRWLAGATAVVLYASSTLVFSCFPAVHTFSLAALFLFAGYVVVGRTSAWWARGLAGLLVGLSVDTRSYLLLVIPLFLWWIYERSETRTRGSAILCFGGGFLVAVVPCLYLFVLSPGAFWFNNVGYHAMRTDAGLVGAWLEKLTVLLMFFLGGPQGNGIQNSILFVVSIAFIFSTRGRREPPRLAFQIALFVGFVSLLPTPVYPGYFSLCIPFLLVSTVCVASDLFASVACSRNRLVAVSACVALLVVYLGAAIPDFRKYLVTGEGIASVGKARDKGDWRLERILEVSRAIDGITSPGEVVASFWPGYLFQTHTVPWPGLENDFVLPVADKMTAQQREQYHVLALADIWSGLAAHVPRVVVLGNQNSLAKKAMGDNVADSLRTRGYSLVRTVGNTSIYVCCSRP